MEQSQAADQARRDAQEGVDRLNREREEEDKKKMSVPCFGRVYKRQMIVHLISLVLIIAFVFICLFL